MSDHRAIVVSPAEEANGTAQLAGIDVGAQFVVTVAQARQRIRELQEFVQAAMIEGVDFGKIPGTPKPTLYKPGAEKLCEIYGLAPIADVVNRVEDWENGFFQYETKCRLISKRTGVIVAEGLGSCNSKEKRYRNQDSWTLVNTILKMSKKRALIDATLSATRSSGLFTQDIEDLGADADSDDRAQRRPAKPARPQPKAEPTQAPRKFADLSDDEKRETLSAGWIKQIDRAEKFGLLDKYQLDLSRYPTESVPLDTFIADGKMLKDLIGAVEKGGEDSEIAELATPLRAAIARAVEAAGTDLPF
jgi:hypothetical protein